MRNCQTTDFAAARLDNMLGEATPSTSDFQQIRITIGINTARNSVVFFTWDLAKLMFSDPKSPDEYVIVSSSQSP